MALLVSVLTLGVMSTSASDPMGTAIQQLDEVQLQGLALVGAFLQEHGVPAPWMANHRISSNRRLQQQAPLPEACKTKCPQAEAMMQGLQQKMTSAMLPHASALASASGSGSTDMAAMMKVMKPLMKSIMEITFQDMCENKATYTCMTTNQKECFADSSSNMGMVSFSDPAGMAKQYGPVLNCFCDVCPGSKQAYADMTSTIMSALLNALSSLGSGGGSQSTQTGAVEQDMLKAMCPIVGMTRCFEANPTQCSHMTQGSMQQGMGTVGIPTTGNASISDLRGKCDAASISTSSLKEQAVTSEITIAGLDFAKANSNTQSKDNLVSLIKSNILTKLPGYDASDIRVSLSAGSEKAFVTIDPLPGSTSALLASAVNSGIPEVSNSIIADVKAMPSVSSLMKDGSTKDQLTIGMTDASADSTGTPQQSADDSVVPSGQIAMILAMAGSLAQVL